MKIEALSEAIRPPIEGSKFIALLAWLIALVALLRIAVVVFSSPIIGYANNYDFLRTSACTGVWQTSNGAVVVHEPDISRPTRSFVYNGDTRAGICMRTTEVLFSKVVSLWHDRGDAVDIREISALKIGLLALVFGGILSAVRSPAVKIMLAAGLFLGVSDAAVIPYFNTLYTDSSTLPALFVAIAACVWIGVMSTPPSRWQLGGCAAVLLWLAVSKQQYGPLAAAFALMIALLAWLRWRNRKAAVWMTSCALLALVLFTGLNYSKRMMMDTVVMANNSNVVLGAVLPKAVDQSAALQLLGLPERCLPAIGQGWFTPGFQENNPCPEVSEVSRIQLLPLFISQPQTFWQPLERGIELARPFYPRHLGVFEDRNSYANPVLQWIANTSLSLRIAALPLALYQTGAVVAMVSGIASAIAALGLVMFSAAPSSKRAVVVAALQMFGLGGITVFYALASSVFGDGYADFEKHIAGMVIGFGCQAAALLLLVGLSLSNAAQALRRLFLTTTSSRKLVHQPVPSRTK